MRVATLTWLLLCAATLCAVPASAASPPATGLQTVWAPMAEAAAPDHRARIRLIAGFHDAVLVAERPFHGHGLIPGVGFPLGVDLSLNMTSRPFGIFERIQFHTGLLVQHSGTLPIEWSVRLFTRRGPGGITLGIEPHFITGLDANVVSLKLYASRRWQRGFVTLGGQLGASLARPEPIPAGGLAGGVGIEVIDDLMAVTLEVGSNLHDRHRVMTSLALCIGGVQIQGGVGVTVVDTHVDPGFQAMVAVPLGRIRSTESQDRPGA